MNSYFVDTYLEHVHAVDMNEKYAEYYQALQCITERTDSAPFIEFMLKMILEAVSSAAPKSPPKSCD